VPRNRRRSASGATSPRPTGRWAPGHHRGRLRGYRNQPRSPDPRVGTAPGRRAGFRQDPPRL